MNRVLYFVLGVVFISTVLGKDINVGKTDSIKIHVSETEKNNQEQVTIDVQTTKIENDEHGNFKDAEIVKVAFKVTVQEGNIHVNGLRAQHGTVTAFHFHAEIDEISKGKQILSHHLSPIMIRVLVIESTKSTDANSVNQLLVEAQIVEIDNKKVKEIDVTQIVTKLDSAKHELLQERKVTIIKVSESQILSHPPKKDIHVHSQGGHLPDHPLKASKKQMDKFHKKGKDDQPMKPKSPLHSDKTSFGGKIDQYEHSICKGFYRLSFAARLSIYIVVTVIGLATVYCCIHAFCCKPSRKGQKFNLDEFEDKCDFDGVFDAPPLDTKIPLEKQQLVLEA